MAFDNVKDNNEASKKALLEAMATQGSAGRKAFEDARSRIGSSQQEAVQRALASAALGPAGATTNVIQDAYGQRQAALSQMQAGFDSDLARRQGSVESYLSQVGAAVPAVQARMDQDFQKDKSSLERELATRQSDVERAISLAEQRAKTQAAKDSQDEAWEGEKRAHERSKWAADAAKASASKSFAGLSGTKTEVKDILGGQAENLTAPGSVYAGQDKNAVARALGAFHTMSGSAAPPQISSLFPRPKTKIEKDVASSALASKYATKGVDPKAARTILDDKDYQDDVAWLLGGADGKTQEEALEALRDFYLVKNNKPRTYAVLVGEYVSRLPRN